MQTGNFVARHSTLPVLNWLGGHAPKAYLRIDRSNRKLASAGESADSGRAVDDENVLSAGDALREVDVDAGKSASDTDIFIRGDGAAPSAELSNPPMDRETQDRNDARCDRAALREFSIDDLRKLASKLHVPDRSKITDADELIDEICKRI